MKRVIVAVFVVGFLTVSCGGGNIKKVQNGVFGNYDNTITVGKAIENNKFLKGGKWKAVEMNGRDIVTYTAKLTGTQVMGFVIESMFESYRSRPNLYITQRFAENLTRWVGGSNLTSMSKEEIDQVRDIIKTKLVEYERGNNGEDLEKLLTFNGNEMTLSFVMNQDGTFTTNMLEFYTEVTLNCFNNLKVRYNAKNFETTQYILDFVYKAYTPSFY
ncbi:MAG: hypothetical protein LBB89_10025 [Treponema sp.]|nr:hypothetical protein [Treponema sp.]